MIKEAAKEVIKKEKEKESKKPVSKLSMRSSGSGLASPKSPVKKYKK